MAVIRKSKLVPYSCEQMFKLVNDIELYADFLPYFAKGVVHYRDEDEVKATLFVTAAGMEKSFTTHNRLQTNKMIEMRLIEGPFSHLEGFWRFDESPEGCLVSFDLEFTFSSKMMAMLVGPVFEQVSDKMIDAFAGRAKELYGKE